MDTTDPMDEASYETWFNVGEDDSGPASFLRTINTGKAKRIRDEAVATERERIRQIINVRLDEIEQLHFDGSDSDEWIELYNLLRLAGLRPDKETTNG